MVWKIDFSAIFLWQIRQFRAAALKSQFHAKFRNCRILEGWLLLLVLLLQLLLYLLLSNSMWHGSACWDCHTVGWLSVNSHKCIDTHGQYCVRTGWVMLSMLLHISAYWFTLIGYNIGTDFISSTAEFNMHMIGFDQILRIGSYKMEKQNGHKWTLFTKTCGGSWKFSS